MKVKSDTEYIAKTGHTIDIEGNIPLEMGQELVRCKNCRFSEEPEDGKSYCKYLWRIVSDDWFCWKGERKTDAKEN